MLGDREVSYPCSHAKSLPASECSICNSAAPASLLDLCFIYIIDNLATICDETSFSQDYRLKDGVVLPSEISEKLFTFRQRKPEPLDNSFLNIFRDKLATRLKRVKLWNTTIDDNGLKTIVKHKLSELEVSNCHLLTEASLQYLTSHGQNLTSLSIENAPILPTNFLRSDYFDREYIVLAPKLKRLSVKNHHTSGDPTFFHLLLKPLFNLTHLDLSDCSELGNMCFLPHIKHLNTLILYNVETVQEAISSIIKLKNLKQLDISQSKERNGKYRNENQVLATIVENLPELLSLDISGTNLAGTGVAEYSPANKNRFIPASDIPGLSCRVHNPFQFLGLYGTSHVACQRHDIPAKMISGDANEEQILVAATVYRGRSEVLQRVLNDLYHLFRFETCEHIGHALTVVLDSMDRHIWEKHIQISGSATLFYIAKGKEKASINVRVKRRIISAILNGMFAHRLDETMLRNGCLTLCQFKIPQDVLFEYDRLVKILLHCVYGMEEGFVQRIGIYLLNSLACQVDGAQKQILGDLGAISKMILLISDRLNRGVCDDVLEVAWSTMWNVTDETPKNCHRFLEEKGMEFFLSCLDRFPDKEELLRNMMGLLGNVAEVKNLRPYLMTREYVSVFSELLDSCSDGIEVSYNAAGVISHMASDGAAVWLIKEPSRESVLKRMVAAIDRWDIKTERNINYRSFEPILYLVKTYDTPECQHWAVWALANLTKVYPNKYCLLVESEGGLILLEELLRHDSPPIRVKELASEVIGNCRRFRAYDSIDSDSQYDG